MGHLRRVNDFLSKSIVLLETIWLFLAAVALITVMVMVSMDATGRYFFHHGIGIEYRLTKSYLMPVLVLMPLSWAYKKGALIKLDILESAMPKKISTLIYGLSLLVVLFIFLVICWYSGIKVYDSWSRDEVLTGAVGWPIYLSRIWVFSSFLLITSRIFLQIMEKVEAAFGRVAC